MAQITDPQLLHLLDDVPNLRRALGALRIVALDIGARRGFTDDLLPLAAAVDAVGFEPDVEECSRLNAEAAKSAHPWRSLRFVPLAIGPEDGPAQLNLYHQRGCSSLLEAAPELAAQFLRGNDYQLEGTATVTLKPLDTAATEFGFADAAFLKIDVQGFEREIFRSGRRLLDEALLAVRSEVTLIPIYHGMPLMEDIVAELRGHGFVPMGFEELHHWRRATRVKPPRPARDALPHSRGQMIHGDLLFFRDPDKLPDEAETLLPAAFLALAYGYLDHAEMLMRRPVAVRWLRAHGVDNLEAALAAVSRRYSRLARRWRRRQLAADLKFRARQLFTV